MNIEEVAAKTPERIFKEPFDPDTGLQPYQVRKLCQRLGLAGKTIRSADTFMRSLCRLFVAFDCSLVEINPLVVTVAGDLVALDASHLFASSVTRIGCRRGTFLRGYMYEFIEDFAPHLTRELVQEAFQCRTKADLDQLFSHLELPVY